MAIALLRVRILVEPAILGVGGDPVTAISALDAAGEMTAALGRAHDAADLLGGRAVVHLNFGNSDRGLPPARDSIAAWYELGNLGRLPPPVQVARRTRAPGRGTAARGPA